MYWIVFNNDWPLVVCTSQVQADAEVADRKRKHREAVDKNLAGHPQREVITELNRNYFHWHDVPASKII